MATTALADLLPTLPAASVFEFDLNARRCLRLDLTERNPALAALDPADTAGFTAWVRRQLRAAGADYAAGGYGEDRALYAMSPVFAAPGAEPRTVHLGLDLWSDAGAPVHAVLDATVHSTRDNAAFGDYGPTIVLEHAANGQRFYTLYGHLARGSLETTRPGQRVAAGQRIGWLGDPPVNGGWPPHLHFQVIDDLRGLVGDHPGVAARTQAPLWLARCPDPNLLLRLSALS